MKIAIWHNLISGGGKRALNYHIKALRNKGHQVKVWAPDTIRADNLHFLDESIEQRILPLQAQLKTLDRRFRLSYQYINRRNEVLKKHCSDCAQEINAEGFDLAFVNSCSINYMSFMGLYLKLPSVMYLGEPYRWNYEALPDNVWSAPANKLSKSFLKNHIKLIANRIQVFEEINAAKSYTRLLVNSRFTRENVMRSYGIDSEVCYLGIDDIFFAQQLVKKKPYVVGLGLIYHLKGIDRAIKTVSKVPSQIRPEIIWIGNGEFGGYGEEMRNLANKLCVKITFEKNVEDHRLHKIIGEAAVMIYMPKLEPFGFAPLEANALGTGVVGIAEGGVRESIIHARNGFLVDDEDFDGGAVYIEKFISNLDFAESFGSQARDFAMKHWSFRNLADNIEASLKKFAK